MKKIYQFSMIGILILVPTVLLLVSFSPSHSNAGVVDLTYLFQQFDGTKEMENKIMVELQRPHQLLDSLSTQIKELQSNENQDAKLIASTAQKHAQLSNQLQSELATLNKNYTEEIWTQINAYIQEFAKSENLDFLHGIDGSGNIMYAAEKLDVTKSALQFINKRYHGE